MMTTMLSKKKKKKNKRDNDSSLLLLLLPFSRLLSSSKRRGWLTPPFKADISISIYLSIERRSSLFWIFLPLENKREKNRLFKVSYDTLNGTLNFTLFSLFLSFLYLLE